MAPPLSPESSPCRKHSGSGLLCGVSLASLQSVHRLLKWAPSPEASIRILENIHLEIAHELLIDQHLIRTFILENSGKEFAQFPCS